MLGLLVVTTILLFIPWSSDQSAPTVDLRTELIWSSVATVLLGAVALAFPSRWMAYIASIPTLGAVTDLGPVFLPESGSYSWPVKAVTVVLTLVGIGWIVLSMRSPAREQSTRWVVAPVAAILIVATLWLPWAVVSGIGPASGQKSAIALLFESAATGAPGVAPTRLAILAIMAVGIGGAVLPLLSRLASTTRVAMYLVLGAAIGLVLLTLAMSVRGDAVQMSDHASGIRVALAGFLLITLVWNSRLRAQRLPRTSAAWQEDTGTIPMITAPLATGPITPGGGIPVQEVQPVPDDGYPPGTSGR